MEVYFGLRHAMDSWDYPSGFAEPMPERFMEEEDQEVREKLWRKELARKDGWLDNF